MKKGEGSYYLIAAGLAFLAYQVYRSKTFVPFADPKVTLLRAQYPTKYLAKKKDGKKIIIWNQELADAIERGEIESYEKYDIKKQ